LLYYGGVMLLLVPRAIGESYFATGRVLYGVLPVLLSAALLIVTGWLWTSSGSSTELRKSIANSFCWAVGAVVTFWITLIIIARFRGQ
jgi:hypothetical protein